MHELSRRNFRDLGGLPAAGGRRLRPRLLFRGEGPAGLNEAHRRALQALGVRLVCDLRAEVERRVAPNDWAGDARLLHLDLTDDLRSETSVGWAALKRDPSAAGAKAAMAANYRAMPGALQRHLAPLVEAIIAGEVPVLLHCTAGKDRTGVLVALLLSLLGVPRAEVERDYLRSDIFARDLRLGGSIIHAFERTFGFTPGQATIDAMTGVDAAYLEAALAVVEGRWGSVEAYFVAAGVGPDRIGALRTTLLTDPDGT